MPYTCTIAATVADKIIATVTVKITVVVAVIVLSEKMINGAGYSLTIDVDRSLPTHHTTEQNKDKMKQDRQRESRV